MTFKADDIQGMWEESGVVVGEREIGGKETLYAIKF
jgi:hypothetical protein